MRLPLKIPDAPPCRCCQAQAGSDHAESCNVLAGIRAQEYPQVIDKNGRPWYINRIAQLERTIEELRKPGNTEEEL